jgi:CRP-like cAMP-binding protein
VSSGSEDSGACGELAVIDPAPRDATVVSATPVELMVVGQRQFWGVMEDSPALMPKVIVGLAHGLRDSDVAATGAARPPVDLSRQRATVRATV